jgi:glutamine phosphoribosylpyrophosphate amidotransferase
MSTKSEKNLEKNLGTGSCRSRFVIGVPDSGVPAAIGFSKLREFLSVRF